MSAPVPVYVMPPLLTGPGAPATPPGELAEMTDLLRQLVAVQQEQVAMMKAQAASADAGGRWRAFLERWAGEFPDIGGACKRSIPALERAYLTILRDLTDHLADEDALGNEFALAEFLDRFGTKLTQVTNIMNQVVPLADATPPLTEKG